MRATMLMAMSVLMLAPLARAGGDVPEKVTFTKDVLPILQESCETCHRTSGANLSGMVAPMPLTTYEEVRPWAKAITKAVTSRQMPPWFATDEFHGVFFNERTLSEKEIATIVRWTETGAPRGDLEDAPPPKTYPETEWSIGEPDLVLTFPEPFFVADEVEDLYQMIDIPISEAQLPTDRYIRAIELKPGSEVVHHILAFARGEGERRRGGDGDRERSRDRDDDDGEGDGRGLIGTMAPGSDVASYPAGFGMLLPKGSTVSLQMHYHKEAGPGTGQWDSSSIAIVFQDDPVHHPVITDAVAYRTFEIPPMKSEWKVGAAKTFEEAITIVNLMPHMHLRGSSAKYTAFYPDGTSENLLEVPKYDFNWQIQYQYREPKTLPAGTRLEVEMTFDNSAERAATSYFDPERAVRFGGPTTEEMDLMFLTYHTANLDDRNRTDSAD